VAEFGLKAAGFEAEEGAEEGVDAPDEEEGDGESVFGVS
jgi:hypothetical protein